MFPKGIVFNFFFSCFRTCFFSCSYQPLFKISPVCNMTLDGTIAQYLSTNRTFIFPLHILTALYLLLIPTPPPPYISFSVSACTSATPVKKLQVQTRWLPTVIHGFLKRSQFFIARLRLHKKYTTSCPIQKDELGTTENHWDKKGYSVKPIGTFDISTSP